MKKNKKNLVLVAMVAIIGIIGFIACEPEPKDGGGSDPQLPSALKSTNWVHTAGHKVQFGAKNTVTVIPKSGTQATFTLKSSQTQAGITSLGFSDDPLDLIYYQNDTISVSLGGVLETNGWTKDTSSGNPDDPGDNGTPVPITMVQIQGGTFTMGSSDSSDSYNTSADPPHQVTLTAFKMSKYQVTQAQYEEVMGTNPSYYQGTSQLPATGEVQGNRPVEYVTWYDAIEFCNKLSAKESLGSVYTITNRTPTTGYPITSATVTADFSKNGYRLPTEAQWEYACRAGTTTAWSFGDSDTNLGDYAWCSSNSGSKTHEVGKKSPNAWGLYDMYGNVYEWCWDWYGTYASEAQTDPTGAASGSARVVRGGAWYDYGQLFARSAYRDNGSPNAGYDGIGFRVVRP